MDHGRGPHVWPQVSVHNVCTIRRYGRPSVNDLPEEARLAAHVLLDTVSAFNAGDEGRVTAMDLAFQRINEVGAVTTNINREAAEVSIDMSALLGGCVIPMKWLIGQLALAAGMSETDVIVMLRDFLDSDVSG